MPSVSERQRRYMGAELARARSGEKTQTGMSESQLADFARKPKGASRKSRARGARRIGRSR